MPNSYDLTGKSALVTGGAKGIGRAVVDRLLASGAVVSVWDATPVDIAGVNSEIVDVTRPDQITAALSRMPAGSRIDILVNSAGYLGTVQVF